MSFSRDPPAVLIAALSGRALAAAARSSGYVPLVADLFDDLDTRSIAGRSLRVRGSLAQGLQPAPLMESLEKLADGSTVEGIAYGSGFEDRPNLLDAIARKHPLLGNPGRIVARVKEPTDFAATSRKLGIPHPEIRLYGDAGPDWVQKRAGASGGWHIRQARHANRLRGGYLQRRAEGRAVSVLFLANGRTCLPIGASEQWCDPVPQHPFRYGGAARPADIAPALMSDMHEAIAGFSREVGLVGLNSADFMLRPDEFALLEVNPRPGATLDIFRHPDLFRLHVETCRGSIPQSAPLFSAAAAATVVYATEPLRLKEGFTWPDWTADRQTPRERVARGAPLCTVIAEAACVGSAKELVLARKTEILARILAWQV